MGYVFLICKWLSSLKDFILAELWKGSENINMAEQDKKKRAVFSDCITFPPYPSHLYWCRYWVSSEKSGLRPSLNGSIRLLKWNRNVIRNQCIRACLDIFNNATSHFHPSLLPPSVHPSICFLLSISIITTTVWRKRFGLALNIQSCRPQPWLPAAHPGSTMKIKKEGEIKKQTNRKSSPFHTLLTSILFVRLMCENGLLWRCQAAWKNKESCFLFPSKLHGWFKETCRVWILAFSHNLYVWTQI